MSLRICLLAALASRLLVGTAAAAVPTSGAAAAPDGCAAPPSDRPPDPRCGETLDGRPPEAPSPAQDAERDALRAPKAAALGLVWPLVHATDYFESHHIPGWFRAILTSDDGRVGVRPELNIVTGFLPTVGARFFYRRLPGEGSEIAARFVTAGPPVVFGELQLTGPARTGLTLSASLNHRTDQMFAGIGPNSEATLTAEGHGLARFGVNMGRVDVGWLRPLPLRLRLIAHGDVQRRDYESYNVRAGESVAVAFGLPPDLCAARGLGVPCVDPNEMPGFYRGLRMAHAGVGLGLDARNHLRGGSGFDGVVDAAAGWGVGSDPTRDVRFSAEGAVALAGVDRALILRGWAAMVEPLQGTILPFDELVSPSGTLGMRGFPDGRFRGESGVVGTLEYRYYIAWNIDASLFTDVGTVAGTRFSGLGSSQWFPDFGLGLRFYNPVGPHWEAAARSGLQFTYAPDHGVRVLFTLAEF